MNSNENLLAVIWRGKWIISAITVSISVVAIVLALKMPNKYEAEMLLSAADSSERGGLAGLASQFGGLAGLAGISGLGKEGNKAGEALALLQSRAFIQSFIEKRELLPALLAAKEMDEKTGLLVLDPVKYDPNEKRWVRTPPPGKDIVPTPWEGFDAFKKQLTVSEQSSDGTIKLQLESLSPVLAKQWLEWLVADLNDTIADREVSEAKRSIAFLEQQIENTQVKELHSIFYSLIEEQTKKVMLGEAREDYVFTVLAAPVLPEDRSSPNRSLIVIGATFFGFILSVFVVVILSLFSRQRFS